MPDPTIADLERQIAELKAQVATANAERQAVDTGEAPKYLLLQPFFAEDDVLYPEGTEFVYNGTPNEHMEPLNEPARVRLIPVLQAIIKIPLADQIAQAAEALHARDRAAAEPQRAAAPPTITTFPKKDDTVPIMPNQILPGQRKRGRPKKVLAATLPAADGRPKAQNIMGTVILDKGGAMNTGGGLTP